MSIHKSERARIELALRLLETKVKRLESKRRDSWRKVLIDLTEEQFSRARRQHQTGRSMVKAARILAHALIEVASVRIF